MFKTLIARFQFAFVAGLVLIAHGLDPNAPTVTPFLLALHSDNWWTAVIVLTILLVGMDLILPDRLRGAWEALVSSSYKGAVGSMVQSADKADTKGC